MRTSSLNRRAASALAASLVAATPLAGCTTSPGTSPSGQPSATAPASRAGENSTAADDVTVVASGLDAPWSIAFDDQTPLISERDSGRILELAADGGQREVGTIEGVTPMGEGGLLGIAVHEDHLYAYFTAGEENRLERFELTGQPGSLGLGEPETILDGRTPRATTTAAGSRSARTECCT